MSEWINVGASSWFVPQMLVLLLIPVIGSLTNRALGREPKVSMASWAVMLLILFGFYGWSFLKRGEYFYALRFDEKMVEIKFADTHQVKKFDRSEITSLRFERRSKGNSWLEVATKDQVYKSVEVESKLLLTGKVKDLIK
jgi:hypothetical protein